MSYFDTLIHNVIAAKAATPVKTITIISPDDLPLLDGITTAIYSITQTSGCPEESFVSMQKYKGSKKRACPKLNEPSSVMYVGSSTTGVRKRIEQHIGLGHPKTYALHLSYWFNEGYEITVSEYDEGREVVQLIEDAISHDLKPAFGKTGSNNK